MQPFSLLPFLQTLLSERPTETAQPQEPKTTEQSACPRVETSVLEQAHPNACLDFMHRHDERVKRTKKP